MSRTKPSPSIEPPPGPITYDTLFEHGKISADQYFLYKRLERIHDREKLWEALQRAVLDLLRSDIPLDLYRRNQIAAELERLWWPKEYSRKKRENQPKFDRAQIKMLGEVFKQDGFRDPMTRAEAAWAQMQGIGIEALRQRRKRQRRKSSKR
jgi:hypothetical protein